MGDESNESTIAAVSIRLPELWPQKFRCWFAQVEAPFQLRSITQQSTRYYHIVSSLSPEVCDQIADITETIAENKPHDTIKTRLIDSFTPSPYQQMEALFNTPSLGG